MAVVIALILVALTFDFLNGLHDSANSIATVVSTRVLRPTIAVFWATWALVSLVPGAAVMSGVGVGGLAAGCGGGLAAGMVTGTPLTVSVLNCTA